MKVKIEILEYLKIQFTQPVHVKDNIFSCIQDPDYCLVFFFFL